MLHFTVEMFPEKAVPKHPLLLGEGSKRGLGEGGGRKKELLLIDFFFFFEARDSFHIILQDQMDIFFHSNYKTLQ